MKRGSFLGNSIAFAWLIVLVCCLFVILISTVRLPQLQLEGRPIGLYQTTQIRKASEDENSIGKLGQMLIEMLPEDLAFTVFVPSERAFGRDLGLRANETLVVEKEEKEKEKMNDDSYAIVSRVVGFSAVPRTLFQMMCLTVKQALYDSISGFGLYISKDVDGILVVNRVRSQRVDVKRKDIFVRVMDGAIMDAEFEESVRRDKDEHDK